MQTASTLKYSEKDRSVTYMAANQEHDYFNDNLHKKTMLDSSTSHG